MIDKDISQLQINSNVDLLDLAVTNRWFYIWVPKVYGGLGCSLEEGLLLLKKLAQVDGSLGWMITLCAGANYFARNLNPDVAINLFKDGTTCFGGSGMLGGTATLIDDEYVINGTWKYATGSKYLTHFTVNAQLIQNGVPSTADDGSPIIKSFVINKNDVTVFPDWKCMGMKDTYTYSFKVTNVYVGEEYSFLYDVFYTQNIIDKVPFSVFADLTLLVNYLGMAIHFYKEAISLNSNHTEDRIKVLIQSIEESIINFAKEVEWQLLNDENSLFELQKNIHQYGINAVQSLAQAIVSLYTKLGIIAAREDQTINKIFKDFFTATQHANFRC